MTSIDRRRSSAEFFAENVCLIAARAVPITLIIIIIIIIGSFYTAREVRIGLFGRIKADVRYTYFATIYYILYRSENVTLYCITLSCLSIYYIPRRLRTFVAIDTIFIYMLPPPHPETNKHIFIPIDAWYDYVTPSI